MLPTDFVLHLNDFFHLVFIHEYTYLFNKGLLPANGNNKVVLSAVETALGQQVTSSLCGVFAGLLGVVSEKDDRE